MSGFNDAVREILNAARQQEEKTLRDWSANLSANEQGIVAAHLTFALLHARLAGAAAHMRESGRPCTLHPYGPTLQVDTPGRQAICTCTLEDESIIVDFHGHNIQGRREVWRSPITDVTQLGTLFTAADELAVRIVKHLVGVA